METNRAGGFRRIGLIGLRIAITIGLLAPLGYAVYRQWLDVESILFAMDWGMVLAGLFFLILAQPLMGLISWCVLRSLGQSFPFLNITLIYFLSQAAKYLPGGIWAFPGRVVAYQAVGVEKSASLVSLVEEVSVLFMGASLVGLSGLVLGLPVPDWIRLSSLFGIGACIVVVFVFHLPITWQVALRLRLVKAQTVEAFDIHRRQIKWKWLALAMLSSVVFWLIIGVGFHYLVNGISRAILPLDFIQAASLFGLAWCAGFVIVFAPAGLGVREAAISGLLLPILGSSRALSVAIVARLWWTIGEGGFILFSMVWSAWRLNLKKSVHDNP